MENKMAKIKMTQGKFDGINAVANANGVIAAAAMDQRGSLQKAIAKARGADATASDLTQFKTAVTKILTRYASAILMDPEYGLPALPTRAPGSGVLLAYEKTGYDVSVKGRLPDLLPDWSVRRLVAAGANAIKVLLYYNGVDDKAINESKHAFIERVGAECAANAVPFFLECIAYDEALGDEKGLAFARKKPQYVQYYMSEFSKPQYGVDVLKVEVPVNMAFVGGTQACTGVVAYNRQDALGLFRETAAATSLPFIYLSAGVTNDVFLETLALAAEAGVKFSGVLCGRATWQDGIPVYAKGGVAALEAWLEDRGVANIQALNAALVQSAQPWWACYGGKDHIALG